jgi:uncharacterized protein
VTDEPIRTCLGCRQAKPKRLLVRFVRDQGGTVRIDRTGRPRGRGAYACPDRRCLERALEARRLAHAFRNPVAPTVELTELALGSWVEPAST